MADPNKVIAYQPDFNAITQLPLPGVILTAKGYAPFDFISRFFAPRKGVNEDPVTGTSHCVLAPIWAKKLNKDKLNARQVSARGGNIQCELKQERLLLTGDAVLFLTGEITFLKLKRNIIYSSPLLSFFSILYFRIIPTV